MCFFLTQLCLSQAPENENPISEYVDHLSNVVPVTPNAAAFTTYGNVPINDSKGMPNINILIYTVSDLSSLINISIKGVKQKYTNLQNYNDGR